MFTICRRLSVFDPSDSLSVFPLSMLLLILSVDVNTTAVLLAFVPSSDVSSAIRPFEGAFSLLHVVDILSDVLSAIRPCEGSITLHLVVAPLS